MCEYCDKIYVYEDGDSPFKRYNYRIEYKDSKFCLTCDDETYETEITHCPWCGKELTPPMDKMDSLEEQIDNICDGLTAVQNEEQYNKEFMMILAGRIDALCDILSDIYYNGDKEHSDKFKSIKRKTSN